MEYNTSRARLIIAEYGRHIHSMIDYLLTVDDRNQRTKLAHAVVNVMANMHPGHRDFEDFKRKLWDHLFIMSDLKLDVDSPYPKPESDFNIKIKDKISYPNTNIKIRYYGKNVEYFIEKAIEMEDGVKKDNYIRSIANFLKKSYLLHNRSTVTDDIIANELSVLSNGKLSLDKIKTLCNAEDIIKRSKDNLKQNRDNRKQQYNKNNRNNNNNNRRNNQKK